MSASIQQLTKLVSESVADLGYHYLGIRWVGSGNHATLRIYIDSEAGILVEDCAKVSRHVSELLDIEGLIGRSHHMEVSSPGLDRPLFIADHYAHFLEKEVCLLLCAAVEDRRRWRGVIQAVHGETVTIAVGEQQKAFDLSNIREANLVPHF